MNGTTQIGFIGLGAMGLPMATNLQKGLAAHGQPCLRVWNRTAAKAEPVARIGAVVEDTMASLVSHCDVVFAMTFDDDALKAVFDVVCAAPKATVLVSCATVAPALVARLAASCPKHVALLSCPVFGRPDAAANGTLMGVLAGGGVEVQDRVARYAVLFAPRLTRLGGEAQTANVLKLTGNFCIASVIDMLAQAQALAEKNGVPRAAVVETIAGLMPGPIVSGYSQRIAADEFGVGFTVGGGLKDVGLMRDLAKTSGVSLPFADVVYTHLERQEQDDKNLDWASIAQIVRKDSGLEKK
ncbi:hypothetical protein HDU98_005093 [Podochytrium sp. JEL0797]|nr:hypothetical protein HDU98_005093 [Podochytrium sp. JEL0797]